MKYKLEIQSNGFNIEESRIIKEVKDSLKHKKIILNKINDLEIYYVTDKIVKGEIYII